MGSIGDYGQRRKTSWRSYNNRSRWNKNDNRENTLVQRLLRQGIAAAILLLLVAAGIDGENIFGQGARYVVQSASGSGDS